MEKITITCPALSPNGGIRVILDLAHELAKKYNVTILCPETSCHWYPIKVRVINHHNELPDQDILLISSPHHVHLTDLKIKAKKYSYVQMLEHLFYPNNSNFKSRAFKWYRSNPIITISKWGQDELYNFNRKVDYIGNGVNLEHFPIYNKKKENVILLESPIPINPTKDKNKIALKVAKKLESQGFKVKGYGTIPCDEIEFYQSPNLETLNKLYREAKILIKATNYDFRSTSPLEAGTKGCVTARAINKGDDDLINEFNCLRVLYNEDELYRISLRLLEDEELRSRLAKNMISHIKNNTWDVQVKKIEKICGLS